MNPKENSEQEKSPRWRRILFAVGLGLGLTLFARQAWSGYRAANEHGGLALQPGWLFSGFLFSLLLYAFQALAWTLIMQGLDVPINLRQAFGGYFLSFLPRYIPGSVWGYLSRGQWLRQSCDVAYVTSGLGSVLESAALVSTALVVTAAYLASRSVGAVRVILGLGAGGILLGAWLPLPRLVTRIASLFDNEGSIDPSRHRLTCKMWAAILTLYLGLWASFGASVLCVGKAVVPQSFQNLPTSIFASALSWVLGFVTVVIPAGIGIREMTIAGLLSKYAGLASSQGDLVAVVSRVAILLAEFCYIAAGLIAHTLPRLGELLEQVRSGSAEER